VSPADEAQLSFNCILLTKRFLTAGEKYEGTKSGLKLINTSISIKAITFQAQNCMNSVIILETGGL